MPIKDHDFKPAKILDPIYAYHRSGHRVNMERALQKVREERENRKLTAVCWDCCHFGACAKTPLACKIRRGAEAPMKKETK